LSFSNNSIIILSIVINLNYLPSLHKLSCYKPIIRITTLSQKIKNKNKEYPSPIYKNCPEPTPLKAPLYPITITIPNHNNNNPTHYKLF